MCADGEQFMRPQLYNKNNKNNNDNNNNEKPSENLSLLYDTPHVKNTLTIRLVRCGRGLQRVRARGRNQRRNQP